MNPTTLHALADHFGSDKGFNVLNAHGYTRIYQSILQGVRTQPIRILEIGLLHPLLHQQKAQSQRPFDSAPSLQMWAEYLPHASIAGFDIEDFSGLKHPRIKTWVADQSNRDSLQRAATSACEALGGLFHLIIDDGSHSSAHQQITLSTLLPYLDPQGLYVIEDLHYQPAALEVAGITKTRDLLKILTQQSAQKSVNSVLNQAEVQWLERHIAEVQFFDSLDRDRPNPSDSADALAVIKRGTIQASPV
jgi:hypothetical protein